METWFVTGFALQLFGLNCVCQVIYANGGVPWDSGTHARNPPATILRWGLGTAEEPYLEILNEQGTRVWST